MMIFSRTQYQQLSAKELAYSPEIQAWLSQFAVEQRQSAKELLCHVRFISRDEFSSWLLRTVDELPSGKRYALYSVRKLPKSLTSFWNSLGNPLVRPSCSQGSEDLVYSLISNLVRLKKNVFYDHPSLADLKNNRIHDYVLIDDSIGSGDRVSSFINLMLAHPTFLSWWSFGWVKIYVLSFARTREAETKIIDKIRGSDCKKCCSRKSEKIDFISEVAYKIDCYADRWGERYKQIINVCNSRKIDKKMQLGYGNVMSSIAFHHSIPNNLPGVLWCYNSKWNGLMKGRVAPDWLLALLKSQGVEINRKKVVVSDELLRLLALVKKGIRCSATIAHRLNVDNLYADGLVGYAIDIGFLTPEKFLTSTGRDQLLQSGRDKSFSYRWNRELYIPSSWCAGQASFSR